jgi:hypothetical protein
MKPWKGRKWVIFDRRCGFCLPLDVCFSPKATYYCGGNEMNVMGPMGDGAL